VNHPLVRVMRPLNAKERERLSRLEERRDYLVQRVATDSRPVHYRVAEISALDWVIGLLRAPFAAVLGDTSSPSAIPGPAALSSRGGRR